VIGENVRISTVAITHGALTIRVTEEQKVFQPSTVVAGGLGPAAIAPGGPATVTNNTTIDVTDEGAGKKMGIMSQGASLSEVVSGINALGASPRDLISILESIKAAGALQATIEVI
jgi:flagellar P-ring protein precursor FlgI